jgi:heparan-alpha-glucosaminide N-acetyltransferase
VWTLAALDVVLGVLPLVAANLLLTFTLRVPGCPTGYLGPGGLSDDGAYRNCTGGAHLYVDRQVFGVQHLLQTPTCQQRYHTGPYDPEGVLNWLMVAATAFLGYLQAALFTAATQQQPLDGAERRQLRQLFVCGSSLAVLGVLCGGLWVFPGGPWLPLNKNLWSLSYVLLSSGSASWALALIVTLIIRDSTVRLLCEPGISVGKNSIAIYVMVSMENGLAGFLLNDSVLRVLYSTRFSSTGLLSTRNRWTPEKRSHAWSCCSPIAWLCSCRDH